MRFHVLPHALIAFAISLSAGPLALAQPVPATMPTPVPPARGGPATMAGRTPVPPPNPAIAEARRGLIESQLRSGNIKNVDLAFTDLKKWFAQNPPEAEVSFNRVKTNLIGFRDHAFDNLLLIELAKSARRGNIAGSGYLHALQAACLCQLESYEAARAALLAGMQIDPVGAGNEGFAVLPKMLQDEGKHKELADLMEIIAAYGGEDPLIVDNALRTRIAALTTINKHAEALAEAKRLFNIATIERSFDASTMLQRQFATAKPQDAAAIEKLRNELSQGNKPPAAGATPQISATVRELKVSGQLYEDALGAPPVNSLRGNLRRASLLLLADRPDEALTFAQQAKTQAPDPVNKKLANDMIARCYKAQDGTLGRALAFIMTLPPEEAPRYTPNDVGTRTGLP